MSGGSAWAGAAGAAVTAGYALCSRRLSATPVTSPMVFTGFGLLIGPLALGLVDLKHDAGPVLTLVEATLTLVLFTDAMAVRRADLRTEGFVPVRLLTVGLVLTVGAGWLLAWPLLPGLSAWELALVGAILAPTDAALGKTAIADMRVPGLVRHGLNVESGLNDGMVLPFFLVFLAGLPGTTAAEEGTAGTVWRVLVLSAALGVVVGWAGGRLLRWARNTGWAAPGWLQVYVLAVAAGAYLPAVGFDGSGFIAAWTAGFAFAAVLRAEPSAGPRPDPGATADFAEKLGELLTAVTFLVFGAVLLGPTLEHLTWQIVVYALLSLTVVRMIPVALSLAGTRLRTPTVLYIGWFGPRGLASIVFVLLVVEEPVPGVVTLGRAVAVTVGLSVLLHGLTAQPLAARYGAWHDRAARTDPSLREGAATPTPTRRRERLGGTG
ncbi:cation:proton antiporter [Yinghuangia seranimata]|uniref:cation:proton antiporter n=1 Tax=Yinghuangia seranimata TaxID=408067 RepID=UPI00248C52E8|nr:sodium:proton antiporter [Yinghuangia seranimata]MDI2130513.1 sodium:proton antiporter [Yinghuangia seranimata]